MVAKGSLGSPSPSEPIKACGPSARSVKSPRRAMIRWLSAPGFLCHCGRLLWLGRRRTQTTLRQGLAALGPQVVGGLRFVCSDMWRAYLRVIATKVPQALHVLDRFHITMHLNQAVDQVRRGESGRLRGRPIAERLKRMRWHLLRRGSRVRGMAKRRLCGLLCTKLATGR